MATTVTKIDQKIKELQQKKTKLKIREAENLYRAIQKIMGDEFSSEMAIGAIANTFKGVVSSEQKEAWRDAAKPFCKRNSSRKNKTP